MVLCSIGTIVIEQIKVKGRSQREKEECEIKNFRAGTKENEEKSSLTELPQEQWNLSRKERKHRHQMKSQSLDHLISGVLRNETNIFTYGRRTTISVGFGLLTTDGISIQFRGDKPWNFAFWKFLSFRAK